MFKKGQLWRAKASGNIYLVTRVPDKHCCVIIGVAGPNVNRVGWIGVSAARRRYTLIGNNYQERLPKQAQPGTAFKRWLGEMTSGIPDQRGCRKEDC